MRLASCSALILGTLVLMPAAAFAEPADFHVGAAEERAALGHIRFLAFYLICGVAAAMAQTFLQPHSLVPMVGASGAIAGVMGAYLVLYPHSRVLMLFPFPVFLFELPAVVFLVIWFVVQFLNGINQLIFPSSS